MKLQVETYLILIFGSRHQENGDRSDCESELGIN